MGRWAVAGGVLATWLLADHGIFRQKFLGFLPLRLKEKRK